MYKRQTTDRDYIKTNASRSYDNHFRVGGIKLTIDGSPQGFTAWRDRPYYAPVGNFPVGYAGYPAVTHDQVLEVVDWAFGNNVQMLVHSNGEASSDLLLAAIAASEQKYGMADRRPVLVHGQFPVSYTHLPDSGPEGGNVFGTSKLVGVWSSCDVLPGCGENSCVA